MIELRASAPLVPFGILRLRAVAGANAVAILVGAALISMFFFLTLYMQEVLGYSAIKAGISQLPARRHDHPRRRSGAATGRADRPQTSHRASG